MSALPKCTIFKHYWCHTTFWGLPLPLFLLEHKTHNIKRSGACFNIKRVFRCMKISVIKIRRSWYRLIFIMGLVILAALHWDHPQLLFFTLHVNNAAFLGGIKILNCTSLIIVIYTTSLTNDSWALRQKSLLNSLHILTLIKVRKKIWIFFCYTCGKLSPKPNCLGSSPQLHIMTNYW